MKRQSIYKFLKVTAASLLLFVLVFIILIYTGIIWRSPAYYTINKNQDFEVPIMDMETYDSLGHHKRPYIYRITGAKGSVQVIGIDHTRESSDPQIDSLRKTWQEFKPDIALVEGRLGFLFSGLQDPVNEHGEGGETIRLAKREKIPFYTWEPRKSDEIKIMLEQFPIKRVAMFYSLRPYLSNYRFGKPAKPDRVMAQYIDSRTDFNGIRGAIRSVAEIDSMWVKDYPEIANWRVTSDEYGWPDGYLKEMANLSNLARDMHMCSIIVELVNSGHKVLVTMGSSHAFRIEQALKNKLETLDR